VVDGAGFEPRFSCRWLDVVETSCKRRCPPFYFPKDTFDSISIPAGTYVESIAVVVEDVHEIVGVINEKLHV
jgi:hypothetical protein